MPVYVYISKDGRTREEVFPMNRIPKRITRNGVKFSRSIALEHMDFRDTPGNWPRASLGMGVHISQRREAEMKAASLGVPTEYNRHGDPVMRDQDHETKFMKAMGFCHWNASYRQAAPTFKKEE